MSNKDFANKPKPRSGATRTRAVNKNPTPTPKQGAPLGLLFSVVIALGVLVGLIYFLLQQQPPLPNKATTVPDQTAPSDPQAVQPRQPGEPLPLDEVTLEQQDERFGFYKLLQESEVKTPDQSAYTSTPKTASLDATYRLQTGSFRNLSDAESMKARLTLAGLPNITVSKTQGSNGVWYRVSTGNFTTYNELKKANAKLEKLNIHPVQRKVK